MGDRIMSGAIRLKGASSGYIDIIAPDSGANTTLNIGRLQEKDSSGDISTGNITTTGYIRGPSTFTIDPAAYGDSTGTVRILGGLIVEGTTTTINSSTLTVDDLNITLASGAANAAAADGAGITVAGANATLTYNSTPDAWSFNKNVGIGTTSPNSPLEIRGSSSGQNVLQLSNSAGASDGGAENQLRVTCNGNTNWANLDIQAYQTIFTQNNTERMRITSDGNVGIGTASPLTFIAGNVAQTITDSSSTALMLETTSTNYVWYLANDTTNSNALRFVTASRSGSSTSGSIERMRIDGSGNVGIATNNPSYLLEVGSATQTNSNIFSGRVNGDFIFNLSKANTNLFSIRNNNTGIVHLNTQNSAILALGVSTGAGTGSIVSDLAISSAGNVGIGTGTTNPQRKLHVKGTVEEVIRLESGTAGAIHFFEGASRRGILGYSSGGTISGDAAAGDTVLRTESGTKLHLAVSGTSRLVVDSAGRVTKPYQPFFHAYGSGQTAVSSGSSLFEFVNTYDNVGSHFNTSNSRFTAPVAGRYLFSYMARVDGADVDYFRSFIRINGSASYTVGHIIKDLGTNWDPRYYSFTGTAIYDLAANDYVEIVTNSNSDSYTQYNSESSFYGYLLG